MPATKGPTKTIQYRDFKDGLNRTAARTAIKDSQLFWNENVQPIGSGQQQTLPPRADPITTITAGVVTIWGINIKIAGVEVARLITVNKDGSLTAVDPLTGAQTIIGGAGTVTDFARMVMWEDNPLLIGDPTKGLMSWDGTTLVKYPDARTGATHNGTPIIDGITPNTTGWAAGMKISGAGIPVGTVILSVDSVSQVTVTNNSTASATVTITVGSGAPTSVIDLAVFEGRLWIISALRTITFSAPGSFTDFSPADGAGTATIIDNVFIGKIERLLSALELLWIVGPAAVNAISNVQVTGTGPAITTFSNTNIVANVGTVKPDSVASFFRTFLFLAPYGVYAIVGATPQKLSDDLDGLFPFLDTSAEQRNPSAVFSINNVFVWAVYVNYLDPLKGRRPILLCFARNAWFVASQGNDLTYITSLVDPDTGQPELWGTNGSGLFQLFAGDAAGFFQWQTKLFDYGAFTTRKQVERIAFEFSSPSGEVVDAQVFLENESGGSATPVAVNPANSLIFVGDDGNDLIFVSQANEDIIWITSGFQLSRSYTDFSGNYVGVLITGTSKPFTISALALEVDLMGEWTFPLGS